MLCTLCTVVQSIDQTAYGVWFRLPQTLLAARNTQSMYIGMTHMCTDDFFACIVLSGRPLFDYSFWCTVHDINQCKPTPTRLSTSNQVLKARGQAEPQR
jgi:hypothetical protein